MKSRLALLAIPIVAVLELVLHGVFAARAPAFDDWSALAPVVTDLKREGDVVVVAPSWADPVARRALGDALMPGRDAARSDVTRYAGAVEISTLGKRSAELGAFVEKERRSVGKFEVRRLDNPEPARVLYDFTDHVLPEFADVQGTDPAVACSWNPRARVAAGGFGGHPAFPPQRFDCPGGSFFFVGVTILADEGFRPRRCIWSHPFARGEIVTRFRDVPLGRTIRGHGGMAWMTERELRGSPIALRVAVDGETVGEFSHADGEGWKAFDFPLGAHSEKSAREVTFAVSSPNYKDRHFCFEADTR